MVLASAMSDERIRGMLYEVEKTLLILKTLDPQPLDKELLAKVSSSHEIVRDVRGMMLLRGETRPLGWRD